MKLRCSPRIDDLSRRHSNILKSVRPCVHALVTQALLLCAATQAVAQYTTVQGVDWSKYAGMTGVKPGDTFGQNIASVLQNDDRYLFNWIGSNYSVVSNLPAYSGVPVYYPPFAEGYEASVRPLAQFAWSNAVMLKTGIYNPAVTGVSASDALNRTEMAIRGVAMTHESNETSGYIWGQGLSTNQSWQAAYWAAQDAGAAWMLWDSLSTATKRAVTNMVQYEANSMMNYTVPYWRSPTGVTNYPGDTKAEENAWNSQILVLAQDMMPNNPNVTMWRQKASELMVGSYSRQSDITNSTQVDGKAVSQWLHGYNTFNDGVVVNHNIAHPGYMTDHQLTYSTIAYNSLAGQFIPQSTEFNAQLTWDGITKLNFTVGANPYGTGPNQAPGGTIYHTNANGTLNPEPYFPNGEDWAANPSIDVDYVAFNVYSSIMGLDKGQSHSAMDWANAQVSALQAFQNRPGHNGNLYQAGDWVSGQDELEVSTNQDLAEAWLAWWINQNNLTSPVASHWGAVPEPSAGAMLVGAAVSCLIYYRIRRRTQRV